MNSPDALWLSIWEVVAGIGFIIVIIGVVIEGVEHFKKFPKKDHARQLHIEKVGWFLVVVGLAMEFLGDHAAKRISDREDARINKEASEARVVAGNAEKEAGQANERASKFERDAGELFKVGEQSKQAAANSEVELEKAKLEREKAEAGRLELEKQVLALVKKTKVRTISPKTGADLALRLNGVPKGSVEIIMSDKDAECMAFGLNIKKSLIAAGFSNVGFSPRNIFRAIEIFPEAANSGVDLILCVKDASTPPSCSVITLLCLRSGDINAKGWPYNDTLSTNDFQIWVLPKPIHPDE